jgi:hypothetical protein
MTTDPAPDADAALDQALELLEGTAPEYGGGLSNHGPMVAEALVALGRPEAVVPFVERYRTRLESAPPAGTALAGDEWEHALGQRDRYADWRGLFERELADHAVEDVVADWVPRLSPGMVAAAFHGVIRTAHALRGLSRTDTPRTRAELAQALAYWAATYQELPGPPLAIGRLSLGQAICQLPYLPDDLPEETNISDRVGQITQIADEFEQAVASLSGPDTPEAGLDELVLAGAFAYLGNAGDSSPIALVHTITGPAALELVLPSLRAVDRPAAFDYAWQGVASLHVAYTLDRNLPEEDGEDGASTDPAILDDDRRQALIDAAVASDNEHTIKVTEACLRVFARRADIALIDAATDAVDRLDDC